MFYDLYLDLCRKKGVAPTRAALDIGLSRSTPTTWKTRGLTPQGDTLHKIAAYFGVSVDYLLGAEPKQAPWRPDQWEDYHKGSAQDKAMMINMWGCPPELAKNAPTQDGEGALPHAAYREILSEGGIRLMLDADAKIPQEHLEEIVDFIKFKQRKNGR